MMGVMVGGMVGGLGVGGLSIGDVAIWCPTSAQLVVHWCVKSLKSLKHDQNVQSFLHGGGGGSGRVVVGGQRYVNYLISLDSLLGSSRQLAAAKCW